MRAVEGLRTRRHRRLEVEKRLDGVAVAIANRVVAIASIVSITNIIVSTTTIVTIANTTIAFTRHRTHPLVTVRTVRTKHMDEETVQIGRELRGVDEERIANGGEEDVLHAIQFIQRHQPRICKHAVAVVRVVD